MLQPLTTINCSFCLFVRTTATWLLALSAATSGKVIFQVIRRCILKYEKTDH